MNLSVRARLTGLVALVALLIGVVAATLGVDQVEEELIADELDASANEQLGVVAELVEFGGQVAVLEGELDGEDGELVLGEGEVIFVDDFSIQIELENLSQALGELVGTDALAQLLDAADYESGESVEILTYFGQVVRFDPDALTLEGPEPLDETERPVIPQSGVDELLFLTTDIDVDDVFEIGLDEDELDEDELDQDFVEQTGGASELVFGTREVDGTDYVVFADVSDISRGLGSIRSIVWLSVPVLMVLGGLLAWLLTGRALRPVHSITSQVGAISSGSLDQRVPEPGTGDEIAELAATMNSMLDRLEVDDRRLRQFVSDASHELRSPVAVLRSEAEVARRAPDATSVEELADGVLSESTRLQRIVEDLLVLARGEERQMARRVEVDVDDIVLTEAGRRRSLPVDTRSVSAGRILGTPEAVGRIVTHLLDNAARHGTSRVEVGLRSGEDGVRLWVDDDGPGVPDAERGRIFERFARLDDARTRDRGGAGLGLAVVAESVRSMGGQVTVADAPLGGARFEVRWPSVT
ncbi:MAG: ATP-binding protein [Actinomycetota bacterium]